MEMARETCGPQNIGKTVAELECKAGYLPADSQQISQRRQNRNHSGSLSGGGWNKEVNQCLQNQHSLSRNNRRHSLKHLGGVKHDCINNHGALKDNQDCLCKSPQPEPPSQPRTHLREILPAILLGPHPLTAPANTPISTKIPASSALPHPNFREP